MRLMEATYCKKTFNINWPFCADITRISSKDHNRYWTDKYIFEDKRLRFCSQWIERHREAFCRYLLSRGIIEKNELPKLLGGETGPIPRKPSVPDDANGTANRRYGSIQIGDAQNAFIRFILSKLGQESFDEGNWRDTKDHFRNGCAYCDDGGTDLEMDHGVPINKTKLGEHRLGNLIPSCKRCNSGKHQKDFGEFLGEDVERIQRIVDYMELRNYVPLADNDQIKMILEQAHMEIAALAYRYIAIINTVAADDLPEGSRVAGSAFPDVNTSTLTIVTSTRNPPIASSDGIKGSG
jgi:5-methylcytosine-specific restriction endonuclease McrA